MNIPLMATPEQIQYWDEHKVEICPHVRSGSRVGYCLGPVCRPCMWRKNGVAEDLIEAYESFEDKQ